MAGGRWSKLGLRWKLNLLMGGVLLVTMSVFEGLVLRHERQMLIDSRARHLGELAEHLAWVMRGAGDGGRQGALADYERGINGERDRGRRALVLDAGSRVVAASDPNLLGVVLDEERSRDYEKLDTGTPARVLLHDTTRMVAGLPVIAGGRPSDDRRLEVLISEPLDDIRENLKTSLVTHLLHLLVTTLAMALITNLALSAFVLSPVGRLLAGMRLMERGEWTSDIPVGADDEVGELTKGYNALGRNLESQVRSLVRAEKLASVALAAVRMNAQLKRPVERIRGSVEYLCRHNAFAGESAHAVGRVFDQTAGILAVSEKFSRDFSAQVEAAGEDGGSLTPPAVLR